MYSKKLPFQKKKKKGFFNEVEKCFIMYALMVRAI